MAKLRAKPIDPGVYQKLWELQESFAHIRRTLGSLVEYGVFDRRDLVRFTALIEEARAAMASYLLSTTEEAETKEAGRLFRHRVAREPASQAFR